jgi:hypothetical protein
VAGAADARQLIRTMLLRSARVVFGLLRHRAYSQEAPMADPIDRNRSEEDLPESSQEDVVDTADEEEFEEIDEDESEDEGDTGDLE